MPGWILGALLAAAPVAVDAGLVTRVAGGVTWKSAAHPAPAPAVALGKLREGDELKVPEGGRVTVVYFANGRQEQWRGPARVQLGAEGGKALAGGPPEPGQVDEATRKALSRVPSLVRAASTERIGAATFRGHAATPELTAEEKDELARAKADYQQRRAAAPADDVTVDLAYVVLLRDFDQWQEMQAVLATARARAPGNESVEALTAWTAQALRRK